MAPSSDFGKKESRTANIELWRLRLRRLRKAASPSVFIVAAVALYTALYALMFVSVSKFNYSIMSAPTSGQQQSLLLVLSICASSVLVVFPLGIALFHLTARTIRRAWQFCCQRPAVGEKGAWMPMDDASEAADEVTDDESVTIRMVPSEAFLHVFCTLFYLLGGAVMFAMETFWIRFAPLTSPLYAYPGYIWSLLGQEEIHFASSILSAIVWIVWGLISVCCQKQRKFFLSRFEIGKQAQLMMVFVLSLPIIVDFGLRPGTFRPLLAISTFLGVIPVAYMLHDWCGHGLFIKLKEWILLRPPLPRPHRCYHRIPLLFRYKLRQNVKNLADEVREETGGSQITTGEKYYFSSEQQGGPLVGYDFKEMLRELTFMTAESRMHRLILVAVFVFISRAVVLGVVLSKSATSTTPSQLSFFIPWYQNLPAVLGSGYLTNVSTTTSSSISMAPSPYSWWDTFLPSVHLTSTPRPTTLMSAFDFFWDQCTRDSIAAVMICIVLALAGLMHLQATFNQMKHPIFTAAVRLAAAQFATVYLGTTADNISYVCETCAVEDLSMRYGSLSLFALVLVLEEYVATRQRYRYRFGL